MFQTIVLMLVSETMAGIQLDPFPFDLYNSITGRFTIPNAKRALSPSGNQYNLIFLGIDGNWPCDDVLLEAGIDMVLLENGVPSFQAWYEFYPSPPVNFDFDVKVGHTIQIDILARSSIKATIKFTNLSTRKVFSQVVRAPRGSALCRQTVDWMIMDKMEKVGEKLQWRSFMDFGNITFTDISARLTSGATVDLSSPKTISLISHQSHPYKPLTNVEVINNQSFNVTYVQQKPQ
ncbi:hypothetical protein ACEQ8H_005430 [Pleosporales sp. CAS-2024a]